MRSVGYTCVKSHIWSVCSSWKYSAGNGGQSICGAFFETARFKSYGVKSKRSQYASLLWLARDQVILFDGHRTTSGYCMECKHAYCSCLSYSASEVPAVYRANLSFIARALSGIRARALYTPRVLYFSAFTFSYNSPISFSNPMLFSLGPDLWYDLFIFICREKIRNLSRV